MARPVFTGKNISLLKDLEVGQSVKLPIPKITDGTILSQIRNNLGRLVKKMNIKISLAVVDGEIEVTRVE